MEFGITQLYVELGVLARLDDQAAINVVGFLVIHGLAVAEEDVAEETVAVLEAAAQHQADVLAQRGRDIGRGIPAVLVGIGDLRPAFGHVLGLQRLQHDRAGRGVAAIKRALRTLQDFDLAQRALDLVELGGVGLEDPVNHQRDRAFRIARAVDAADVDLGIAGFGRAGDDRHAGGELGEIVGVLGASVFQRGGRKHRDRGRDILQPLILAAGSDDDGLFLIGTVGSAILRESRGGTKGETGGRSRKQQARDPHDVVLPVHRRPDPTQKCPGGL